MEAILSQLGSNSMCCARTAALQGGCVKQKVKASMFFPAAIIAFGEENEAARRILRKHCRREDTTHAWSL